MKNRKRRISYTVSDEYTVFRRERDVYNEIFKETVLKNRRCAELSLSDLSQRTGFPRSTIKDQLDRLKKRRMIEIDSTQKTNRICINVVYEEIF